MKSYVDTKIYTGMFIVALQIITLNQTQSKYSSLLKWINNLCISIWQNLSKEDEIIHTCRNMDEFQLRYAEDTKIET